MIEFTKKVKKSALILIFKLKHFIYPAQKNGIGPAWKSSIYRRNKDF